MKKKEVIATLIEMSNELDSLGLFQDADTLTRVAENFGALHPTDIEANPDNLAAEHGFLGEAQYNQDQNAMRDLHNEDTLMELEARIEALKRNPQPTQEDIEELDRLLDYRMGGDFDSNNVQWPQAKKDESQFVQDLQSAGANVIDPNDPFRDE